MNTRDKIIRFIWEKELLMREYGFPDSFYFCKEDEEELRLEIPSDGMAQHIWGDIRGAIYAGYEGLQAPFCPYCVMYHRECRFCPYAKRHGVCGMSSNSDWISIKVFLNNLKRDSIQRLFDMVEMKTPSNAWYRKIVKKIDGGEL